MMIWLDIVIYMLLVLGPTALLLWFDSGRGDAVDDDNQWKS